jgi:thiol-disulfide isomerase/thioredoxin
MPTMTSPRLRAPELQGRSWIGTGGKDYRLSDLRGKIVLLDFWTFCCVNCLHVLDELRPLEEKYSDVLVTVGGDSPKFVHEADHDALVAAVERYEVRHPVLDDPELATWSAYAVRAWPTLTVIDPEGYIVAQLSGEGHAHGLDSLLAELVATHEAKGTLHRGDGPFVPPPPPETELRFPGKVIALPDGTFLVSDSGRHSLVVLDADLTTVRRRIGTGERGLVDGPADVAQFSEPQGVCLLPSEVAARVGYDIVVADSVNHALRGIRLESGVVTTIAGTGRQWMQGSTAEPTLDPLGNDLSTPWDVAWFEGTHSIAIAMAGTHTLWELDPVEPSLRRLAGTTNEGLVDGPAEQAWFAQTSGLGADGDTLWMADSETSALRYLRNGEIHSVVGTGLFDFGHRDGAADQALLQHPLGVTVLPDHSVAISDTYNGAIRRYDPATKSVSTLATGLLEPSDAVVHDGSLVVVESAAHRLTLVPLTGISLDVEAQAHRTQRPATAVAAGELALDVVFTPPTGQKLDERYGPATRLVVSSSPPELLLEGAGTGTGLTRRLVLAEGFAEGVLHVSAMAASCDEGGEHAACHVHQQDWGVPVTIEDGGASRLELPLRGV